MGFAPSTRATVTTPASISSQSVCDDGDPYGYPVPKWRVKLLEARIDDGNPCTIDSCDPVTGCTSVPSTGPCDDGSLCSFNSNCVNGECVRYSGGL